MTYLKIIVHSMKLKVRDYKMLFMLGIFPILLASMFAVIFEQAYGETKVEGRLGIIIKEGNTTLGEDYEAFLGQINVKTLALDYEVVDETAEERIVRDKSKDAVVFIDEATNTIEVKMMTTNSLLKGALDSLNQGFAESMALKKVIEEEITLGQGIQILEVSEADVVDVEVIESESAQGVVTSMVIAMFIFAILIGGQFGIDQVFYLNESVGKRVCTAPVKKLGVYASEMFACWMTLFLLASIVACAFEYLFKLGLKNNIGEALFIVAVLSMIATLIGTAVGLMVSTSAMGENIYGFLQTGMVILSGGLVPGVDFGLLSYLSPVHGALEGIKQIITVGKIESIGEILIGTLAVVLIVSAIVAGKNYKEGISDAKYLRNRKA